LAGTAVSTAVAVDMASPGSAAEARADRNTPGSNQTHY
jgi:hypothetical protein